MKKWNAVFAILSLCFCTQMAQADNTIRIGLLTPLSGPLSSEGTETRMILDLLVKQTNQQGGVLGTQVQLMVANDEGNPDAAKQAAEKLIQDKVIAVIGSYASSVTAAAQPILAKHRIVQISNGSTAVPLTEKGFPFFFRVCPRDDQQAIVAAELVRKLGMRSVAIVHDESLYSSRLAAKAKRELESLKINVVYDLAISPDAADYGPVLKVLKDAKPDMVLFTGYFPEAATLLQQKEEMGWSVPFIGTDASNNPTLVKLAGKSAVAGYRFISLPLIDNLPALEAKEILRQYKEEYGNPLTSTYALLAADAYRVLIRAIQESKSTDPVVISDYLHDSLDGYAGYTGMLSFDSKGDREAQIYVPYKMDAEGRAHLDL